MATFAAVAAVISLPFFLLASYSGVMDDATAAAAGTNAALEDLKEAGQDTLQFRSRASDKFSAAARSFSETRTRLRGVTLSLGALLTGNSGKLRDGDRLLSAGESVAMAGTEITEAFDALEGDTAATVSERVIELNAAFEKALPHINDAINQLDEVSLSSIPKEYRGFFSQTRSDMEAVREHADRFLRSSDLILDILGTDSQRRYLVVFQNDRELRPTGGFIGSFALMDIQDGEIVSTEIPAGGSYDLRGGLNQRIAAPDQLRLVNTRWEFQDANWFADFPTSADTLTWFYEKSGGPTIDGVIAVTSTFMEDLLDVIGPVELQEYDKTITAENFFIETQKAVEIEYDRERNRPKQFISDMAPKILESLVDLGNDRLLPLINTINRGLSEKKILLNFRNGSEQALASEFGWTGELKPMPNGDFLAVVDTNIAGGKTDGVIDEDIRHRTDVRSDGQLINTVTIRRTHRGEEGQLFTGVKNIDYMRIYVPFGSELISAEGFEAPADSYFLETDETLEESTMLAAVQGKTRIHKDSGTIISEESGLTVFGNWLQLEPGESRAVRVTYRLPFTFSELTSRPKSLIDRIKNFFGAYVPTAGMKLVVQKQPGANERDFSSQIRVPREWSVRSRVPEQISWNGEGVNYSGTLTQDIFIGMILTKTD